MAKVIRHLKDTQKEFAAIFDKLCYSQSRWPVWCDFIHMTAYSISNAVDSLHKESREKAYLDIAKRYSEKQIEAFAQLLGITAMALEDNPDQDFLGELYMALDLGNSNTGQFFTPYNVCYMMSAICAPDGSMSKLNEEIEAKGFISVCDPCIGGGAMLIAFANSCYKSGINYQERVLFVGQDIDMNCALMSYIQLSLLGCPGYVAVGNSLTQPMTGGDALFPPADNENIWFTPMYFSWVWDGRRRMRIFDNVLRQARDASVKLLHAKVLMKGAKMKFEERITEHNGHVVRFKSLTNGRVPDMNMICEALAHYEDAEENGQLKRFPCEVGDTVYVIASCAEIEKSMDNDYFNGTGAVECPFEHSCDVEECDDGCIRIFKTTCTGFMVEDNSKWITFFYGLNIDDGYGCWGKTAFLARSDAEKALKGVKGDA